MSKVTLEDILETIPMLTYAEQHQVREKIDTLPTPASLTEEEFARLLLQKGLLSALPTGENREAAHEWQPVPISEQPLAEVILEERR